MPRLTRLIPNWARSYPARYRSLYIIFRGGADPIRSDAGVGASSPGMDPILSGNAPKPMHPLPEWTGFYPIRYRSLYIFSRNGSDPIRPDTGAYTSSSGMGPTLSDPIPERIPYLQVWNRSYPIRYRSLCIIFWHGAEPIRSDTDACTSSTGMDPIRSDPTSELILFLTEWIRSDTRAEWSP